ncbi:MAG: chorismate synthase [Lachnospiraceae bacterium]|jgi:chorismate synthase|nr:chorismate synthase [Lachnospiraceae bacterium]
MAGSSFGTQFKITTFGESHGDKIGVIIDGCPSGLNFDMDFIQKYVNRRKPKGKSSTTRVENDTVFVSSGVFNNITIGTPIFMYVENNNTKSNDYKNIKDTFRPGHADFTFEEKYGLRDFRGGGRSSGRETVARVMAGAVASLILKELNIDITTFTASIGNINLRKGNYHKEEIFENELYFPSNEDANRALKLIDEIRKKGDSLGGTIWCDVDGLPAGLGEPVFNKLDAVLSHAIMSIGAVKGVEIGDGFTSTTNLGSYNNDDFINKNGQITTETNHSGGILGGMSNGNQLKIRVAIKPTPSINLPQNTVDKNGNPISLEIKGRHDICIVPRAVVVVESMVAVSLVDMLFQNMSAKLTNIKKVYS